MGIANGTPGSLGTPVGNHCVIQWLHRSGLLQIKLAWSGPCTETSLTPLI